MSTGSASKATLPLTPEQDQFLNRYIRKHKYNPLKQSQAKKESQKFLEAKTELTKLLDSVPDFGGVPPAEIGLARSALKEANRRADEGDFESAAKLLKGQAPGVLKVINMTDFKASLAKHREQITKLALDGEVQAPILANLDWSPANDEKALIARIVRLAEEVDGIVGFCGDANRALTVLLKEQVEFRKLCSDKARHAELDRAVELLGMRIILNGELAPLKAEGDKTRFMDGRAFRDTLGPRVRQMIDTFQAQHPLTEAGAEAVNDAAARFGLKRSAKATVRTPFDPAALASRVQIKGDPNDLATDVQAVKGALQQLFDERPNEKDALLFDIVVAGDRDPAIRNDFIDAYFRGKGWPRPSGQNPSEKIFNQRYKEALGYAKAMAAAARELQPCKIDPENGVLDLDGVQYNKKRELRRGANGAVVLYEDPKTNRKMVVKEALTDYSEDDLVNEATILRHLSEGSPNDVGRANLIKLEGVSQAPNGRLHVVLECFEGANMEDSKYAMAVATEMGVLPESLRTVLNQRMLKEVIKSFLFLRDRNVGHFDAKEANLLVGKDGSVKLIDFGTASVGGEDDGWFGNSGNTAGYNTGTDTGYRADEFALGKIAQVMHLSIEAPRGGFMSDRPPDIDGLTGALERVSNAMTQVGSDARPSLEAVLESSYLKNVDAFPDDKLAELQGALAEFASRLDSDEVLLARREVLEAKKKLTELEGRMRPLGDQIKQLRDQAAIAPLSQDDQVKLTELETKLAELLSSYREKRTAYEQKEENFRNFGDSPEVIQARTEMRTANKKYSESERKLHQDFEIKDLQQEFERLSGLSGSGAALSPDETELLRRLGEWSAEKTEYETKLADYERQVAGTPRAKIEKLSAEVQSGAQGNRPTASTATTTAIESITNEFANMPAMIVTWSQQLDTEEKPAAALKIAKWLLAEIDTESEAIAKEIKAGTGTAEARSKKSALALDMRKLRVHVVEREKELTAVIQALATLANAADAPKTFAQWAASDAAGTLLARYKLSQSELERVIADLNSEPPARYEEGLAYVANLSSKVVDYLSTVADPELNAQLTKGLRNLVTKVRTNVEDRAKLELLVALRKINATKNPPSFFGLLSDPAVQRAVALYGVDAKELCRVAGMYRLRMAKVNPRAAGNLQNATAAAKEILATITDNRLKPLITTGLINMIANMRARYDSGEQ